jgi:hypothetical protein
MKINISQRNGWLAKAIESWLINENSKIMSGS